MYKVRFLFVLLACAVLCSVTAVPMQPSRVGDQLGRKDRTEVKPLQGDDFVDDDGLTDVKYESNEQNGPTKNQKNADKNEPTQRSPDQEEYVNTRGYIVTKKRPQNMSIEKMNYD